MKKKKTCWFSHNYIIPSGYVKAHLHGKLTKLPKTGSILLLLKCSDCDSLTTTFYKEVEFGEIQTEVTKLNQTLNLTEQDVPYFCQVRGDVSCGF